MIKPTDRDRLEVAHGLKTVPGGPWSQWRDRELKIARTSR